LLDNPSSKRPAQRTALVARELARYNINTAALVKLALLTRDSSRKSEVVIPSFRVAVTLVIAGKLDLPSILTMWRI